MAALPPLELLELLDELLLEEDEPLDEPLFAPEEDDEPDELPLEEDEPLFAPEEDDEPDELPLEEDEPLDEPLFAPEEDDEPDELPLEEDEPPAVGTLDAGTMTWKFGPQGSLRVNGTPGTTGLAQMTAP
jgi:hypothetical protein